MRYRQLFYCAPVNRPSKVELEQVHPCLALILYLLAVFAQPALTDVGVYPHFGLHFALHFVYLRLIYFVDLVALLLGQMEV